LEAYLTSSNKNYKDWIKKTGENGFVTWKNLNTGEEQTKHPGVKVFEVNKKALRVKAQIELDQQFGSITDRKYVINEAIISLRKKVTNDLTKIRLKKRY
jgi:hypothetical protein